MKNSGIIKIFICHASRDKQTVQNIINGLPENIQGWIDEEQILAGESMDLRIKEGIDDSDLFLFFISEDSIKSEWVKKEVNWALEKESSQRFRFLLPIAMGDFSPEKYNSNLKDKKYIPLRGYDNEHIRYCSEKLESEIKLWKKEFDKRSREQTPQQNKHYPLWIKISNSTNDLWEELEDICVNAVINGGISAMSFFKNARRKAKILEDQKNPSYSADLQATISVLRAFDSQIKRHLSELNCELYYLGEETVYKDKILLSLDESFEGKILSTEEFFEKSSNTIRVIIDAIDGTSNFVRSVPFFCSSVAVFIEDQLRVSAIYDPLHHQVYSGILPGPYNKPEKSSRANVWDIASGRNENLKERSKTESIKEAKKSLAIHIPRSNTKKRDEFIAPKSSGTTLIRELADRVDTIYALNSGLLALAQVTSGALDSFINIYTNSWDVAAGDVLLKACDGQITNFEGKELSYNSSEKVSVVASNSKFLHSDLMNIIKTNNI